METEKNKCKKMYEERKGIEYATCNMCMYNGNNIVEKDKENDNKYDDNYCKVMQKNREKDFAAICRFFLLSGKVTLKEPLENTNVYMSIKTIQEQYEEYKQCKELGCKICKFKREDNYCDIISECINDEYGLICTFFEPDFNQLSILMDDEL